MSSVVLHEPFSVADVRHAIRLEKESLDDSKWTFLREGDPAKLGNAAKFYYTTDPSKLFHSAYPRLQLKFYWSSVPIPVRKAALLLNSPEVRKKWDDYAPIVANVDENRRQFVILWALPAPWPLQTRLLVHDETLLQCDGDAYIVLYKGKTGDDFDRSSPRFPSSYTRASAGLTFTITRPNKERPETHCDVFAVTNNAYGGVIDWFPYRVVAKITANGYERVFGDLLAKGSRIDLRDEVNKFSPAKVEL
eukprot:m.8620 g.8620  ORF g.8620 m.8620 type:complete len:249 (+) comp20733_c0_seq1:3-749(+)